MNLSADEAKLAGAPGTVLLYSTGLDFKICRRAGKVTWPFEKRFPEEREKDPKACGARWEGERQKKGTFSSHDAPYLPSKILHNLCFSFLLGVTAVPREIETMLMQKFMGKIRCILRGDVQVAYCYH